MNVSFLGAMPKVTRARRHRPSQTVLDTGAGARFRGAQIRSAIGDLVVVRAQIEAAIVGDIEVLISSGAFAGASAPAAGNPCVVRLDENDAVLEVVDAPPADMSADVASWREFQSGHPDPTFNPGRLQPPHVEEFYR